MAGVCSTPWSMNFLAGVTEQLVESKKSMNFLAGVTEQLVESKKYCVNIIRKGFAWRIYYLPNGKRSADLVQKHSNDDEILSTKNFQIFALQNPSNNTCCGKYPEQPTI